MRTLAKFTLDVAAANETIKNGLLPQMIEKSLANVNPEAAYFYTEDGKRTAIVVFDMKAPSDVAAIAEPWFLTANATVEFWPVMKSEDLKAGLQKALEEISVPA